MNTELHGFSKQWEHEANGTLRPPGYQRPYAWTTEEAGEILEDLITFMQGRAVQTLGKPINTALGHHPRSIFIDNIPTFWYTSH